MLKKILFATALFISFAGSVQLGRAAPKSFQLSITTPAGACGDPRDCNWPCTCGPGSTKPR